MEDRENSVRVGSMLSSCEAGWILVTPGRVRKEQGMNNKSD